MTVDLEIRDAIALLWRIFPAFANWSANKKKSVC